MMREMRVSIIAFVKHVSREWFALVVGLVGGVLWVVQQLFPSITISPQIALVIFFAGLLWACFLAFHRMRLERDGAVQTTHNRLRVSREGLRSKAVEGELLIMSGNGTLERMRQWKQESQALIVTTLGSASAMEFEAIIGHNRIAGTASLDNGVDKDPSSPLGEPVIAWDWVGELSMAYVNYMKQRAESLTESDLA